MSETREPTLEDIAAARDAISAGTPEAVLNAFLPRPVTHLGQTLIPITAGHELLFAQIKHPLSTGSKWEDIDVLMALFIFSRPSRHLFEMVGNDTFEREFFGFLDSIPVADIEKLGNDMVAHWLRSRSAALAMENPHSTTKKKAAALDGGSTPSPVPAKTSDGFRKWLSTTFPSRKSSR